MQTDRKHFAVVLLRGAALSIFAASLLSGCAMFFGNGYYLLGTVPKGSASPAKFEAELTMSTHAIELRGFGSSGKGQTLQVSVVNLGQSGFMVQNAEGQHVAAEKGIPIYLYKGDASLATNVIRVHVFGIQHSTLCEFHLETSSAAFQDEIKVYRYTSSAPM
jgi:hypothetical protein